MGGMPAVMAIAFTCFLCFTFVPPIALQEAPTSIEAENYVLNLHYDHCKKPMKFSWTRLKCECPLPLSKVGSDCVCDNCIFEDIQQWAQEGTSNDLPNYINEIFEEIDTELQDAEKNDHNKTEDAEVAREDAPKLDYGDMELTKSDPEEPQLPDQYRIDREEVYHEQFDENREFRRKRAAEDEPHEMYSTNYQPVLLNLRGRLYLLRPTTRQTLSPWHRRILNRWYFDNTYNIQDQAEGEEEIGNSRRYLHPDRVLWSMPKTLADELTLPEHRVFFPRSRISSDYRGKKILKLKGKPVTSSTFSDSVVDGSMGGSVTSGYEHVEGNVNSFRGTGALAIGSGGGSAGAAAFTGMGTSELLIGGLGASAAGQAFIGDKAMGGTSTTSLLYGTGDAIAVNSLGGRGSSSAAGFSTKNAAGGATAAYGPASASISASPGRGDTSSSATFGEGLNTAAGVTGEGGTIIESSSTGDANQDIHLLDNNKADFFRTKPIRVEPAELTFESLFYPE